MVPAPSAILLQLVLSACVSASLHHTTGAGAGLKHVYGIAPFYSSASIPVSARHARSSVHLWPQCSRPAHTTQSRRSARPVMVLFQLSSLFGIANLSPEALTLKELILKGVSSREECAQADALIDALAAKRVRCDPSRLGTGLWRAAYVRGTTPRWKWLAAVAPNNDNRAGQIYDVSSNKVQNYAELFGPGAYLTASGSFQEVSRAATRCPKDFNVQIESGGVVIGGRSFTSDAISGPGCLRVLYLDESIRIFESPRGSPEKWERAGLQVVQVRDDLFQK